MAGFFPNQNIQPILVWELSANPHTKIGVGARGILI